MVRHLGDQCAVAVDRGLVVARGVAGIALPVERGGRVATVGVAAHELAVQVSGLVEVGGAQGGHGGFEFGFLARQHREVDSILAHAHRLETAQAVVDQVQRAFLLALQFGHVARELLVLAAQLGQFGAQRLDLVRQFEHDAAAVGVLFGLLTAQFGQRAVAGLAIRVDLGAQLQDGLARLVVTEQRGLGRQAGRETQQPGTGQLHQAGASGGQSQGASGVMDLAAHRINDRSVRRDGSGPRLPRRCLGRRAFPCRS